MQVPWSGFWAARQGNIAIMGTVLAPLFVFGVALSVDYSAMVAQRRSEQTNVDLAAIAAANDPKNAEVLVARYFFLNRINSAIRRGNSYVLPDGTELSSTEFDARSPVDCVATVQSGYYAPVSSIAAQSRFVAGDVNPNAVQVKQVCKARVYFGSSLIGRPDISVTGTSSSRNLASFWIGSRLASLNGGILNAVLGGLTGSSISLSVMDYNALVDANVDILPTIKALATSLDLQGATYGDVLDAKIGFGQLFAAMRGGGNMSAAAQAGLKSLEASLSKNGRTFSLGQIIDMSALEALKVGSGYTGKATANAYDIVRAAAFVSNGSSQVAADLNLTVPGLASVSMKLAIGEPPQGATSVAVNGAASLVRTAQARLYLNVKSGGLLSLAGTEVNLPLYLELANGEAQLTSITCWNSRPSSVKLAVVPGVASLAIGNVDPSAFINFGSSPRVMPATFVQALVVKITGSSDVNMNNVYRSSLEFSGSDIDFAKSKSVSVTSPVSSVTGSLIDHLNVAVNISGLNIGLTGPLYTSALKATLGAMQAPLDNLVDSVLAALGVKIGVVDVGVTGASCGTPVLVL